MKNLKTSLKSPVRKVAFAALALLALGCAGTSGKESKTEGVTVSAAQANPVSDTEQVAKGPQLWADNCGRCHNTRSPSMYSDQQWEVVGMHMRVRANLTADDSRQILAFLKNAH